MLTQDKPFQIMALKRQVFFLALFNILLQVSQKGSQKPRNFTFRRSSILRFIEPLSFLDGLALQWFCSKTIDSRCDMIINTDVVKKDRAKPQNGSIDPPFDP